MDLEVADKLIIATELDIVHDKAFYSSERYW